jgi:hypothetical protein
MKSIAVLATLAFVIAPTIASAYDGDGARRGWWHHRTQRNVPPSRSVGDVMAPDRSRHNVGDVMAPSRTRNPVGDVMAPSR